MTTLSEKWESYRTKRRLDHAIQDYINNHLSYARSPSVDVVPLGLPLLQRFRELTHDFADVNHVDGPRFLQLILYMNLDHESIVKLLSIDTIPAKALLLAYRYSRKELVDPTALWDLAVQATRQNLDNEFTALAVLYIGEQILATSDLAPILVPVLEDRPGESLLQQLACDWIFEHPNPIFAKTLDECLRDPAFIPKEAAEMARDAIRWETMTPWEREEAKTQKIQAYLARKAEESSLR